MDIREAVEGTKVLAKQYRSVLALGAYLEGIASLEQAEREATNAAQKAQSLRTEAMAALEQTKSSIAAGQAEVARTTEQVVEARRQVTAERAAALKESEEKADAILAAAQAEAAGIAKQVEDQRRVLTALAAQGAQLRTELEAAQDALKRVKASAAALAG